MQKTAKILSLCAALAAVAVTVTAPAAEARGRSGGIRAASLHIGVGHRFHGHRFYRPRVVHLGLVAPYGYDYCRWYQTSYGLVKRCFYY